MGFSTQAAEREKQQREEPYEYERQIEDFASAVMEDRTPDPDHNEGLKTQLFLDAVEKALASGKWVDVEQE